MAQPRFCKRNLVPPRAHRSRRAWRGLAVLFLAAALLTPAAAPAQQALDDADADPARIQAGQLPTEAQILLDTDQDGFPLTISFVSTDIRDVARFFHNLTGLNVVIDPDVSGPVTVSFTDVPWDLAFESILISHQLGYDIQRNIVRVSTLTRLATEARDRADLAEQEELASPLSTMTMRLSYARAENLVPIVQTQLSSRGEVMIDGRTNTLIVRDTDQALTAINDLVIGLDISSPQVMIESRIVETTKDFSRELGIQWGFGAVADAAHGNTTGLVFPNNFQILGRNDGTQSGGQQGGGGGPTPDMGLSGTPFAVNLPAGNATSGIALTLGNILDSFRLDVALSAMEEQGRGKIISSPKVTAQDNIQASIESGQRIPVQTLVDNTASVTFINANLQLQVTPQITADRTIMLDLIVDKSEPDFGNAVLGIPTIFTRRAETRLLIRDGGTTVIGGIFQMSTINAEKRVPFFHRIPLLGSLFKSQRNQQSNNELLIFITPRILEQ